MEILYETSQDQHIRLEHVLSVWPIISCFASHVPAGDLISLSRTSTTIRALTHDFPGDSYITGTDARQELLRLGDHQTVHWTNLKASSRFECASLTHPSTKQHPTRPCRFCSRPICQACIVRTFFTNPHDNTFKHRTRYLCPTCWESGNLRKDFRYPIDHISREHLWRGRNYTQRGSYCSCSASSDNWLCVTCKDLQNHSAPANQGFSEVSLNEVKKRKRPSAHTPLENVKCFGIDCTNEIFEADRDRRRICLWCAKPLPRQFAGEDRLRWESRQVEIRAATAASRSADIAEWARNRFRTLTMSREEMRGKEACLALRNGMLNPEQDRELFVRHLDAVNYRAVMNDAPSPDSVYQSKHGRWTYTRGFFYKVNDRFRWHNYMVKSINGVSTTDLFNMTHTETGLRGARTNLTVSKQGNGLFKHPVSTEPKVITPQQKLIFRTLVRYQALLWEAQLLPFGQSATKIMDEIQDMQVLEVVVERLLEQIEGWEQRDEAMGREWRPPSLQMIIEDAKESLRIKKALEDDKPPYVDNGSAVASTVDNPLLDQPVEPHNNSNSYDTIPELRSTDYSSDSSEDCFQQFPDSDSEDGDEDMKDP